MNDSKRGQLSKTAADVYEEFFVPALFKEWAIRVSDIAGVASGQSVVDVACGTGLLTREMSLRTQPDGIVVGIDCNQGMLDVARRKSPDIDWRLGYAESLPFPDESFDAVVSQFGLMFFEDRNASLTEMWRVLKNGGQLTVAVWDTMENVPGYASMTTLLQRLFGDIVLEACHAPFNLGNAETLLTLFSEANIPSAQIQTQSGTVQFTSIESWVFTDVKGWTLAEIINDEQYKLLLKEALQEMIPYLQSNGMVAFPSSVHIVTATKT